MAALRDRRQRVDASVAQLTSFILPVRTWMKLEETKGLEMSIRDGAPKSAAVRLLVCLCVWWVVFLVGVVGVVGWVVVRL